LFVGVSDPADQLARVAGAVERAQRYADAGADCVYPILIALRRPSTRSWTLWMEPWSTCLCEPGPALPSLERARELGAARASLGPGLWRSYRERLIADLAKLTEAPSGP